MICIDQDIYIKKHKCCECYNEYILNKNYLNSAVSNNELSVMSTAYILGSSKLLNICCAALNSVFQVKSAAILVYLTTSAYICSRVNVST